MDLGSARLPLRAYHQRVKQRPTPRPIAVQASLRPQTNAMVDEKRPVPQLDDHLLRQQQ